MQKKRDILSEKRESGMTPKKREFTPESGTVDTYVKVTRECKNYLSKRTFPPEKVSDVKSTTGLLLFKV